VSILSAGTILLLLAGLLFFSRPDTAFPASHIPVPGDPISPEDGLLIQSGDFILRRGNGLLSSLIVQTLGDPHGFSHAGILYADEDGSWYVIHSVSRGLSEIDGVQRERLESFTRKSVLFSTAVVRARVRPEIRQEMVRRAQACLAEACPFDREFLLGGSAIYCTELLWRVLPPDIRENSMIYQGPAGVIRFESFFDADYYDVVFDYRTRM